MRHEVLFTIFLMLAGFCPMFGQATGDREIAARFAPVFYQALGDKRRSDYITSFDFDGDWRGDNNWKNADDPKFALLGYIYYAVSETQTHYFIHYAVFHPRDYKGGEKRGVLLSDLLREGVKLAGKNDPTGLAAEATAAHENDMEGALVVAEKSGSDLSRSKVVYVETLHHNMFTPYALAESRSNVSGVFKKDGESVLLYVEPKGHGIEAYSADEKQTGGKEFLIYKFTGKAGDPEKRTEGPVDYDLLPIATTLWPRARADARAIDKNITYGAFNDYGSVTINVLDAKGKTVPKKIAIGKMASAFLGTTGGINMARPPWAWFSNNDRKVPLGQWFFDPATTIKRDFALPNTFSTTYTRPPSWVAK